MARLTTAVRRADGLATSATLGILLTDTKKSIARADPKPTRRCFDNLIVDQKP